MFQHHQMDTSPTTTIPNSAIYLNDNNGSPHDINDDLYNSLLTQTPEEVVAGLQAKNELITRNGFASSLLSSPDHEEVTIETLLEEDPLLSFTTTLDRQESNDTILQTSSPLSKPMDPEKIVEALTLNEKDIPNQSSPTHQQLHSQSLPEVHHQIQQQQRHHHHHHHHHHLQHQHPQQILHQQQHQQLLQQQPLQQPTHQSQIQIQVPQQQAPLYGQVPIQYSSSEVVMTSISPDHQQIQQMQQFQAQQQQQIQAHQQLQLQLQQQLHIQAQQQAHQQAQRQAQQHAQQLQAQQQQQIKHHHHQQQQQQPMHPNTRDFRSQIQSQVMFQQNTNASAAQNGVIQTQQPTTTPISQYAPQQLPIQSSPAVGYSASFSSEQSPPVIKQQVLYTPAVHDSPLLQTPGNGVFSPIIPQQMQTPMTSSRQKPRSKSQSQKASPPSPPTSLKPKRVLKPPMNKSNSTTTLNKVKKNSFSNGSSNSNSVGGTTTMILKKSKSFLASSSPSTSSPKVLYQTLDFSKNFSFSNPTTNTTGNQKDLLKKSQQFKITPFKSYEFVFENTGSKEKSNRRVSNATPRRQSVASTISATSNSTTPTNAKLLKFSKPPSIDTSFYSPNSSSPTNSDASGTSPLNSLNFKNPSQSNLIQQTSPSLPYQKISPESFSSSSSSTHEQPITVKPKRRITNSGGLMVKVDSNNDSDVMVPSFQLDSMKSGMIEFQVRDFVDK